MRVTLHRTRPRHIVIDGFVTDEELPALVEEAASLITIAQEGQVLSGSREKTDTFKKRNRNVWLDTHFARASDSRILSLLHARLFGDEVKAAIRGLDDLLFENALHANRSSTLLSIYGDGDFYGEHADEYPGIAANLLLARKPLGFTGGSFQLADNQPYEPFAPRRFHRIAFEPGRLILFPTRARHFVEVVHSASSDARDHRISVQYWPSFATAS